MERVGAGTQSTARVPSVWQVAPAGELDVARRDELAAALLRYVADGSVDAVVDWRAVTFADSAGLGWLAGLGARARLRGGRVTVVGARPVVRRAAAALGLDALVTFAPS